MIKEIIIIFTHYVCQIFFEMYCINPQSDEPIFCLFDPIGKDDDKPSDPYIDGNAFARELLYMDGEGKKRIQIWINTEGGSVKDGFSICSAMLKSKTKVDTLNVGIAYSMGGVILSMGRKREAMDYTSAMCHMAYNPDGTEDKSLDVINEMIITALSERMGKGRDEVKKLMAVTTFYTAEQAKEAGLIDEVVYCNEENKPRSTADKKATQAYGKIYAKAILNKLTNQPQTMKAVAKALGLNPEASEEAISFEISKLKNKADEDDKKMKSLEDKKKAADEELDKYKAEAKKKADEDAKAKAEEDKKKAAADEDDKKAKAEAKIKLTAENKGLKLSDKDLSNYKALAGHSEENLKAVIETIENITTTKKGPQMKVVNKVDSEEIGIPLIPAGAKTYEDGTVEAGDTKAVIDAINSFDFHKYKNRQRISAK